MKKKQYILKRWVVVTLFYAELVILTLVYINSIK